MKKKSLALLMVSCTIIFAACAAKKQIALTQMDADRAASKFPGASLASLNEGKMHFEEHCGKCHGLPKPVSESEAEWRKIMPDMAEKSNIDDKKEDLILQYVLTMGPMN